MQHKKLDYIPTNEIEYKKSSNRFIGITVGVMMLIVMVGMIFG